MPGAKKEEARNEDKPELLRVLSLLSKEPVKCSKKDCDKIADEIIDRFADGTEEQAAGRSIRELEQIRDECMVAVQRVLAKYNMGSGETLNNFEARLRARAGK